MLGSGGKVLGVDKSAAMLAVARRSVPIFTQAQLPGLPYAERMRLLAKAYGRLGPGQGGPSQWVVFTASAKEQPGR